jgi:tetrahydromethanopterin S-methyltransferase subunit A
MPNEDSVRLSEAAIRPSWPVEEGRYMVGNPDSPVAVCTMASVGMELPMDKIAIMGKCVTENLGIEKIVKNVISNPGIRFIILCGKDSHGHFVGQAIKSLKESGVGPDKRIIGARGAMPVLKNLGTEEIERFREQVEPVDMTGETDTVRILARVNELFGSNPGPLGSGLGKPDRAATPGLEGGSMEGGEDIRESRAQEHPVGEWERDPHGFFTIRPDPGNQEILVEHHDNDGRKKGRIFGKSAEDMYHHIIKSNLVSRHDHAAYLGRELAKAEVAMRNGLDYEQDADLKISNGNSEQENRARRADEPVTGTWPGIQTGAAAPETAKRESLESLMEERIARLAKTEAEDRSRAEAERKAEKEPTRFLTYFKGFKEIRIEDATRPDQEFRALLRERGLSRVF